MTSPIPTEGGKSWTWELHELSEGPSAIVYDEHGRMIADHLTPAIAAKIAAAPAMLEALTSADALLNLYPDDAEDIAAALGIENDGALREACAKVRAALARATGGEDVRR